MVPSRDFTSEELFSSLTMSMHSSTHSLQMCTVGPATSLRSSCWLFPQNEQQSVFLESLPPAVFISERLLDASRRPRIGIRHRRCRHDRYHNSLGELGSGAHTVSMDGSRSLEV